MEYLDLGEVFSLRLDSHSNPPEEILKHRQDACNWKYQGVIITDSFEDQFKLVGIGSQPNLEHAQRTLRKKKYFIPGDQWLLAFREKYPQGYKYPVGIANASWLDPFRNLCFPFINSFGDLNFEYRGSYLIEDWCWLVLA